MAILRVDNIYKYSLIFNIYIDTTFVFINKGPKSLFNIPKTFFQAILIFIT